MRLWPLSIRSTEAATVVHPVGPSRFADGGPLDLRHSRRRPDYAAKSAGRLASAPEPRAWNADVVGPKPPEPREAPKQLVPDFLADLGLWRRG